MDRPSGSSIAFGAATALSENGRVFAVGDPTSEKVYVYELFATGAWALWKTISSSTTGFGSSLALNTDGMRILIGHNSGFMVWQYHWSSSAYVERNSNASLEPPITMSNTRVAMHPTGTYFAVADDAGNVRVGSTSPYTDTSQTDVSVSLSAVLTGAYLSASNFGRSLAIGIDGSKIVLAVGMSKDIVTYTYTMASPPVVDTNTFFTGVSTAGLRVVDDSEASDDVGYAVTLSKDGLIMCFSQNNASATSAASSVYTYYRTSGNYTWNTWGILSEIESPSTDDKYGYRLALSPEGDLLVTTSMDFSVTPNVGTVRVYKKNNASVFTAWTAVGDWFAIDEHDLGTSIAIARPRNNLSTIVAVSPSFEASVILELGPKELSSWNSALGVPRYVMTCDSDVTLAEPGEGETLAEANASLMAQSRLARFKVAWDGVVDETGVAGWTRFAAYYGSAGYSAGLDLHNDRGIGYDWKTTLNTGQKACAVSHLQLWIYLSEQTSGTASESQSYAWVFEDDAMPGYHFEVYAEYMFGQTSSEVWDMIYVGHGGALAPEDVDASPMFINDGGHDDPLVVSRVPGRCLHAYILSDVGAWRLMNWVRSYMVWTPNATEDSGGLPKIDDTVTMLYAINTFALRSGATSGQNLVEKTAAYSFIRANANVHGLRAVAVPGIGNVNLASGKYSDFVAACEYLAELYPFQAYTWHKGLTSTDATAIYGSAGYTFEESYGTDTTADGFTRDRGIVFQDDVVGPGRGRGAIHGLKRYLTG